jgi:hypothetical protein
MTHLANIQRIAAAAHAAVASRTGGWSMVSALVAIVIVLAFGMLLFRVCRTLEPERRDDDDTDSGGGGGGPGRPPGPASGPRGPETDPVWWPEFERQFAAHIEDARRVQPVSLILRAD